MYGFGCKPNAFAAVSAACITYCSVLQRKNTHWCRVSPLSTSEQETTYCCSISLCLALIFKQAVSRDMGTTRLGDLLSYEELIIISQRCINCSTLKASLKIRQMKKCIEASERARAATKLLTNRSCSRTTQAEEKAPLIAWIKLQSC
jgi:hypothetical protein